MSNQCRIAPHQTSSSFSMHLSHLIPFRNPFIIHCSGRVVVLPPPPLHSALLAPASPSFFSVPSSPTRDSAAYPQPSIHFVAHNLFANTYDNFSALGFVPMLHPRGPEHFLSIALQVTSPLPRPFATPMAPACRFVIRPLAPRPPYRLKTYDVPVILKIQIVMSRSNGLLPARVIAWELLESWSGCEAFVMLFSVYFCF